MSLAATSLRLSAKQKAMLEEAAKALERRLGRKLTRGELVEALAAASLARPELLDLATNRLELDLGKDPLFDPDFTIDMGRTDAKKIDAILYGGK